MKSFKIIWNWYMKSLDMADKFKFAWFFISFMVTLSITVNDVLIVGLMIINLLMSAISAITVDYDGLDPLMDEDEE